MAQNSRALEPSMVCVKNLIVGMNFLLVLTGMLLIAIGSTIKGIFANFDEILGSNLVSPATFLIVVGFIILVVSLFGCIGAIKESTLFINLFTVSLIVIFVFEISAGIAGFAMQTTIQSTLSRNLKYAIQNDYLNDTNLQDAIDTIQSRLECCGADSPADWDGVLDESQTLLSDGIIVPNSCCGNFTVSNSGDDDQAVTCNLPQTDGCLPTLVDIARAGAVLLTGAAITVALIQAMAIYFSNQLAIAIRRAKSIRALRQLEIRSRLVSSYQQVYQPINKEQPARNSPVVYLSTGGSEDTTA